MSDLTYLTRERSPNKEKPLVWLHGEIKTPPFARESRIEAGVLLRQLQHGDLLGLPHSRPMPVMGPHCHELRIQDRRKAWRIIYCIEDEAIVILEVFEKRTQNTPLKIIQTCRQRLKRYSVAKQGMHNR